MDILALIKIRMSLIASSNLATFRFFNRKPISQNQFSSPISISYQPWAIKTGGGDLLRKSVVSTATNGDDEAEVENNGGDGDTRVNWDDQILEYTVPLVGFVKMILHSGKYESGNRLSAEDERIILERLLPYHPECEKKIGCGVDYITIGYHPNFVSSRCFFIVRKDGELVDFSYWKCMKGLIRKNYPLYANNFILRNIRRRRRNSD